jgi:hypothetical protein
LLTDEHALKNAQTIAGWLGFVGTGGYGLFKYLAKRKGKEIESVSPVIYLEMILSFGNTRRRLFLRSNARGSRSYNLIPKALSTARQ